MFVLGLHDGPAAPFTLSSTSLNSTTTAVMWAIQARTAGAVSGFRFTYGARTGTPPTYVARIETLDASGNPSGTDAGGASPTAVTFTPPASTAWDNTIRSLTFANSWTPTAGQLYAIVIRYSSGTVNVSNFSSFATTNTTSGHDPTARGFPYHSTTSNGTTWTKIATSGVICWVEGGVLVGTPMQSVYGTLTSATNGHRSAAYFTLPASLGSTYEIHGVDIAGKAAGAGATCTLKLWDSSFNVLRSITIDGDHAAQPGTGYTARKVFFGNPYTAATGTKYYVGFESDGTATVGVTGIACSAADEVACYPNGENMGVVTWNGTTKSENNLVYPCMNLWIDNITASSGSGSVFLPGNIFSNVLVS